MRDVIGPLCLVLGVHAVALVVFLGIASLVTVVLGTPWWALAVLLVAGVAGGGLLVRAAVRHLRHLRRAVEPLVGTERGYTLRLLGGVMELRVHGSREVLPPADPAPRLTGEGEHRRAGPRPRDPGEPAP